MLTTDRTSTVVSGSPSAFWRRSHFSLLELAGLLGTITVAVFLGLFRLSQDGFANSYYAAGVRSMLQNWHNFFFVSFDPGGFVTVDKPPLGYWIQTLSAKILGFHGWSILLPQVLAGAGSVVLLYLLVRRAFGPIAGLLAGLSMALMPVAVADNRNNTVDSLLVFTLLLASWAVLRAADHGRLRWLVLGMALVGAGFNIKMLEAYLALPALLALYAIGAPIAWRTRLWNLAIGVCVLVAVSLSWAVAVDSIPPTQRPYVGSSQHNSEIELAFGYNGLQRLIGMRPFGGRTPRPASVTPTDATRAPDGSPASNPGQPASGAAIFPGGGGPAFVEGGPSPLRLFGQQLGGQASWLLPLAIAGAIAVAASSSVSRQPISRRSLRAFLMAHPGPHLRQTILWGTWLLTAGGFFSVAGFFHPYYLVTLAPPIAALASIGTVVMWRSAANRHWAGWLLPLALFVTAFVQVLMLQPYPDFSGRLTTVIASFTVFALAIFALSRLRTGAPAHALVAAAAGFGVLGLLITPAVWSAATLAQGGFGGMPSGGPSARPGFNRAPVDIAGTPVTGQRERLSAAPGGANGPGALPPPPPGFGPDTGISSTNQLVNFLEANRGNTRFMLAVPSSMAAAPIIIQTGQPVMAMGGFSGGDPIVTADQLAADVAGGTVRYFLLSGRRASTDDAGNVAAAVSPRQSSAAPVDSPAGSSNDDPAESTRRFPPFDGASSPPSELSAFGGFAGGPPGGPGGQTALTEWVTAHCSTVPTSEWQDTAAPATGVGFGAQEQLYDCASG
jgi:4-amino-4-deoxy-L-arabinose transferase-like glycosyltransferase